MIGVLLLVFLLVPVSKSHAESDLNDVGQCDEVALRRFCNNSPFNEYAVINTPDMINLRFCKDKSTTRRIVEGEVFTKDTLNEFCRGVYGS